MAMNSH